MPYHAIIYRLQDWGERAGSHSSTACRSMSSRASCPCLSPCWKFSWRCRVGCMKVPGLRSYRRPRVDHSHRWGSCCSHTASCPGHHTGVRTTLTHHLPSPSPCEVRMFCHRHTRRTGLRSLTRGHRSLTQGHRSCHMAGSSKQERLYWIASLIRR